MGVAKNAVYKVHNGVDFDTINFETIASQVKMSSGVDLESGFSNSKTVSGSTKLPNGLIIQWGKVTGWSGGKLWIPFSISFTTQVFSINITSMQTGAATANNTIESFTLLGLNMNSSVNSLDTFWIAVGY